MPITVAPRPKMVQFYEWDGTNDVEIRNYLLSLASTPESVAFVVNADNTADLTCPYGTYTVNVGDFVTAESRMYASPEATVLTPAQLNDRYYPYPDLPTVTG